MTCPTPNIDTVPLLKKYAKGKKHDDIVVLCINHDLGDDYLLAYYLQQMFHELTYIAVPYDTQDDRMAAYRSLLQECYYAVKNGDSFDMYRGAGKIQMKGCEFAGTMDSLVTLAIAERCLPKVREGKKLLIVEDGGYHSSIFDNISTIFPELEGRVIGSIEQTTSGARMAISKNISDFPQLTVARSKVKMNFESVFIGQSVVNELNAIIYSINRVLNYMHIVISGYGIVGRAVANSLVANRCKVEVHDTDERIRKTARADGYNAVEKLTEAQFDRDTMIIGCTGTQSLTEDGIICFLEGEAENLWLASASSKKVEFKSFLDLADGVKTIEGLTVEQEETLEFIKRYKLTYRGRVKHVYLLTDGYPVNFNHEAESGYMDGILDLVFVEMAQCAEILCGEHELENKMYVIGAENSPISEQAENEIIERWFKLNRIVYDGDLDSLLQVHPDTDYLRSKMLAGS